MVKNNYVTLTQLKSEFKKFAKEFDKAMNDKFDKQEINFEKKFLKLMTLQSKISDEQVKKYEALLFDFKSDFYDKVDPVLKEITTDREARTLLENRLEELEEIHPNSKHSFATI